MPLKAFLFIFLFSNTLLYAQEKTFNIDSCIVSLNTISISNKSNGVIKITKKRVVDIITAIKNCKSDYSFPSFYEDRKFELFAPNFIKKVSYGYGDNNFYYSFNDSNNNDSLTCSIVVYYDFDGSYKKFFLGDAEMKKQKVVIKTFGKRTMYLFKNWQEFYCGKLFLDKNTFIFYATSNKKLEGLLQKSILTFKWLNE